MGSSSSKESKKFVSKVENAPTVQIRADICASWGFGGKAGSVKDLCKYLSDEGISVNLDLVPIPGMGGKYNVIQIAEGREIILFSNDSKNKDAVVANMLRNSHFADIKSKISI